jgi:hypothetical protein
MKLWQLTFSYCVVLLLLFVLAAKAGATEITLTQAQIDAVLADNPCEVCPDPPPIDPPPIDPPPIDPPPEPGNCEDTTSPVTLKGWNQVFIAPFPMPTYQNVTFQVVPQYGYYSIGFDTGNTVDDGKISLLENGTTPGIRHTSISECKGDLNVVDSCKLSYGLGGGMRWATNGRAGSCDLKKNTRYYFNVTFLNPDGTSACGGSPCYINLQITNL